MTGGRSARWQRCTTARCSMPHRTIKAYPRRGKILPRMATLCVGVTCVTSTCGDASVNISAWRWEDQAKIKIMRYDCGINAAVAPPRGHDIAKRQAGGESNLQAPARLAAQHLVSIWRAGGIGNDGRRARCGVAAQRQNVSVTALHRGWRHRRSRASGRRRGGGTRISCPTPAARAASRHMTRRDDSGRDDNCDGAPPRRAIGVALPAVIFLFRLFNGRRGASSRSVEGRRGWAQHSSPHLVSSHLASYVLS